MYKEVSLAHASKKAAPKGRGIAAQQAPAPPFDLVGSTSEELQVICPPSCLPRLLSLAGLSHSIHSLIPIAVSISHRGMHDDEAACSTCRHNRRHGKIAPLCSEAASSCMANAGAQHLCVQQCSRYVSPQKLVRHQKNHQKLQSKANINGTYLERSCVQQLVQSFGESARPAGLAWR